MGHRRSGDGLESLDREKSRNHSRQSHSSPWRSDITTSQIRNKFEMTKELSPNVTSLDTAKVAIEIGVYDSPQERTEYA